MSEKGSKSAQNNSLNNVLKWSLIVLSALVLEAAAILSAVKITESRGKADVTKLQNIFDRLSSQQMQINALEKMPAAISSISQQLNANAQNLNSLAEDFNYLNGKVNEIPGVLNKVAEFNHRLDVIEETSRGETLILNLALIIKENVLYQRTFTPEADLLNKLSQNIEEIKPYVAVIDGYKNKQIQNNLQLARQYADFAQSFIFSNEKETPAEEKNEGTVAKGVQMLKNTVANINFDKVVVLKKDKLTKQQKELIEKLDNLVANYNFKDALDIMAQHPELKNTNGEAFAAWQQDVTNKLNIEKALNALITKQLSGLRQDIKENKIEKNIIPEKEIDEPKEIQENIVEETTND